MLQLLNKWNQICKIYQKNPITRSTWFYKQILTTTEGIDNQNKLFHVLKRGDIPHLFYKGKVILIQSLIM